jgi:hypothetical protein
MAKFTAGVPLNIRLPGGFEAIGAAGTTHRIPDSLVEEFTRDQAPSIPGFAWVTQDETTAMSAATIIVGAVTATSIIASAVTATTAVFKGEPWIDAKAYGATGDGVTDDTAALQLAINALTTGANAQLYIPAGTYLVSATLTLPLMQYKRIFGAGQNATIISATQTNSPILKTTVENTHSIILERLALSYATQRSSSNTSAYALAYTATSAGVGSGFYYWTVRNLLISGANVGIGILAGSGTLPVWGSSFENISMARIATTGLYLKSPTTIGMPALRVDGLRISNSNSTVVNSAQAIYLESAEITFDELDIEGWYNGAFYVQGGNPVAVRGLHIENHRMTTASTLVDISDGPVTVTEAYIIATVNASGATATMFNTFTNGSLDLQHVLLNITKTAGTAYGIARDLGLDAGHLRPQLVRDGGQPLGDVQPEREHARGDRVVRRLAGSRDRVPDGAADQRPVLPHGSRDRILLRRHPLAVGPSLQGNAVARRRPDAAVRVARERGPDGLVGWRLRPLPRQVLPRGAHRHDELDRKFLDARDEEPRRRLDAREHLDQRRRP